MSSVNSQMRGVRILYLVFSQDAARYAFSLSLSLSHVQRSDWREATRERDSALVFILSNGVKRPRDPEELHEIT